MNEGEWLDYRCDDSRLGIYGGNHPPTPALKSRGNIIEKWSVRIGGSFQQVEPVPDGSGDVLMSDNGGIQRVSPDGIFRWRTRPFGAHWISHIDDLDNDGELEILTSNGREIVILSASSGEILFRDVVGPPFSYGTYAPMFKVHSFFHDPPAPTTFRGGGAGKPILGPCFTSKEVPIYDCSNGVRNTRVLHKLWMDDGYHPSIVIGDVNNDGVDEIVIARLGGVYVFEPKEGRMISQTIWKSDAADDRSSAERRRNYGHFELADINGDGNLEAIILSDKVTRHIAVLGNDGQGNFTPLWDRLIEHIYPNDTTELRYTSNSIRDFDGDGKLEIAVSIFNERKDEKWHTEVLKAETGERLVDLEDQYLRGVQNANGKPMLFLSEEKTRGLRELSTLSVYSPQDAQTVWALNDARFAERADHPPSHYSEFKPDVFAAHEIWEGQFDGKEGFLVQTRDSLSFLSNECSISSIGEFRQAQNKYRVASFAGDSVFLSHSNGELTKITPEGSRSFLSCGYHLTTEAHIAARPGSTATVAEENGNRYLTVPDFSGNIHLFRNQTGKPQKIEVIRGRSRIGYDGIFHAASIIETKKGKKLVVIDDAELPHARLSLYSLRGERIRSYEFPDMPASILGNRIGCYDWLYFQHSRGEAIFASFYRSFSMNSECSLAFLIESGEILWHIDSIGEGDYGRGAGPWGTSGLVDNKIAVFCAKDTLCYLDLETGTLIRPQKVLTEYTADAMKAASGLKEQSLSTHSSIDDPFTAYGTPIIHGNDHFIAGCLGGYGMLNKDGVARWWNRAVYGDVLYKLPGITDLDGDGRLEFGQGHADGTFRICDCDSGVLKHSFDLQAIATDVLTVGRDFLFGTSDGRLIRIGWNGTGFAILQGIQTGSAMGSPIAADFNGDGVPELYVITGDGNLRCFEL